MFIVLDEHVVSPWHLLSSTCSWTGIDPLAITSGTLGDQVARVTDEKHALHLTHALQRLLHEP